MAQQILNVGTAPNDSTGESLRSGMIKVNENFTELYERKYAMTSGSTTVADPNVDALATQFITDFPDRQLFWKVDVVGPPAVQKEFWYRESTSTWEELPLNQTISRSGDTITLSSPEGGTTFTINDKQDVLVSGSNIKTINGETILGAGNIEINGGGVSNPNEFVPTSQADLTNVANAGKIACIQNNFTLTSDIIIADGIIFRDCGGKIIVGANDVTFVNNSFDFPISRTVFDFSTVNFITESFTASGGELDYTLPNSIDPDYYTINTLRVDGVEDERYSISRTALNILNFTGTLEPLTAGIEIEFDYVISTNRSTINSSSTFKNGNINLVNFGLVGDGDLNTNTSANSLGNRNVIREAQKIYNLTGAQGRIEGDGVYLYDLIPGDTSAKDTPRNMYVEGTAGLILGNNVILGPSVNSIEDTDTFSFFRSFNGYIKGGKITGDVLNHDFTSGVDEGNHGIVISGYNDGVEVETVVENFPGDCIISKFQPEYVYLNSLVESTFTAGLNTTINTDGTSSASSLLSYSDRFDISGTLFTNAGQISFGGGSFGGLAGLDVQKWYAAFYDATGNDTTITDGFIGRTAELYTNQVVDIPDGATQVRIIIYNPDDFSGLSATLYAPNHSKRVKIKSPLLTRGVRQGISNLAPESTIEGITFRENGRRFGGTNNVGVLGSPGFAIDLEDGQEKLFNVLIKDNTFINNASGDVIIKASVGTIVSGNRFYYNTYPDFPSGSVNIGIGLSSEGYNGKFYNNVFQGRSISLSREDDIYDNKLEDVRISFGMRNEIFRDHSDAKNVYFNTQLTLYEASAYIKNNRLLYDKGFTSFFFQENKANFILEDNIFDFNNVTLLGNPTGVGLLNENKGYIKNLTIKNLRAGTSNEHTRGILWAAQNIDGLDSSISWKISRSVSGQDKSFRISNSKIQGWLDIDLQDYANTNGGDSSLYPTVYVSDCELLVNRPAEINLAAGIIRTGARDFNLVVENTKIEADVDNNFNGDRIVDLDHFGTTIFRNVDFITDRLNAVVDLNSFAAGDSIKFIDCTFTNMTFTLRPQDEIIYTKLENRVIIRDEKDLPSTLETAKEYFIDGEVTFTQPIILPNADILFKGYGFENSRMIYTGATSGLFESEVGGCGSLYIEGVALEANVAGGSVFNLTNSDGFGSIELTRVNFDNCVSLGTLNGFRQGLEINTGRFGGTPDLIFEGTWLGGYFIQTSIVRSITDSSYSLFNGSVGQTFGSRFGGNPNILLPTSVGAFNFTEANFTNDETFILDNAIFSGTGTVFSGTLDQNSTKTRVKNSTGVTTTEVGGLWTNTTEVQTTFSAANTYTDVLGTKTYFNNVWFDNSGSGQLTWISTTEGFVRATFTGRFTGTATNTAYTVKIVRWDDSASSFVDIPNTETEFVTSSNVLGNTSGVVTIITRKFIIAENDYIKLQIKENAGTSAITLKNNSRLFTEE